MANYSFLKFYDKSGNDYNFDYNETAGYWEGTIYMPRIAVDLYENQHIFIIEQVLTGSPLGPDYTFPVLTEQSSPTSENWRTRWEDDTDKDNLFTYLITEIDSLPYITKTEIIDYENVAQPYSVASPGEQKIITSLTSNSMKINIVLTSDEEGIYERTLVIEDLSTATPTTVAVINIYGETVGEDERFRLMLENFGRSLNHSDAYLLRDYDIKEGLPDWRQINEKRKELFIAGEDIFPYIGSYRGLINIIRLFGYQDLRVKEYWLNIDANSENYKKTKQIQINGLLTDENQPFFTHPVLPTTTYRKTGELGLFYDITVETGEVDDFGVPITINSSQFTPEEVLIKLFALKQKLNKEFVPVNARIIDIIGEGIYFERYGIRTWTDQLETFTQDIAINVDFISDPELGYVRDLRRFQVKRFSPGLDLPENKFTNEINPYTMGQDYPAYTVQGLIDSIEAFYAELRKSPFPYRDEKDSYYGDEPGILAGCPVVLRAEINQFTWDDLDVRWENMTMYTWDNIDFSNFYEIQWTIEKGGPNPYYFQFRGPVMEYYRLPHFLPYAGKYRVTMEIFDLFNARSIQVKNEYIEVQNNEIEIGAFARWRDWEFYTLDSTTDTWDDLGGSTWHFQAEGISLFNSPINAKIINFARFRSQESALILNTDTNQYEYYGLATSEASKRFGTLNLCWDNMDIPFDEMYHTTWDMMEYHGGDFLGGFRIFSPGIGDKIKIDDYDWFVFGDESPSVSALSMEEAVVQLNGSNNPGIRKFDYHIFQGPSSPPYIKATAKMPGAYGWHFVYYDQGVSPGNISGDIYTWVYPTWLNSQPALQDLLARYPSIDPNLLFLDAPLNDLISGDAGLLSYWQDKLYLKTEEPSAEFPEGERRGELPSMPGSGAFNGSDLRVFVEDFTAPIGVPIFFVHNHSSIPGKNNVRWRVTNAITGELVIDVINYFLIINFLEESKYSIECWLEDSNNNESYRKREGFVTISNREHFAKRLP